MKFSIRDLLLVTVIVAACVAWAIDHSRQAREVKESKGQLEKMEKSWGGFFSNTW